MNLELANKKKPNKDLFDKIYNIEKEMDMHKYKQY